MTALSAEIIPREIYPSAVAWRSSVWQGASIAGPALGGILYGFSGAALAYAVVVALFIGALVALTLVTYESPPVENTADPPEAGSREPSGNAASERRPLPGHPSGNARTRR